MMFNYYLFIFLSIYKLMFNYIITCFEIEYSYVCIFFAAVIYQKFNSSHFHKNYRIARFDGLKVGYPEHLLPNIWQKHSLDFARLAAAIKAGYVTEIKDPIYDSQINVKTNLVVDESKLKFALIVNSRFVKIGNQIYYNMGDPTSLVELINLVKECHVRYNNFPSLTTCAVTERLVLSCLFIDKSESNLESYSYTKDANLENLYYLRNFMGVNVLIGKHIPEYLLEEILKKSTRFNLRKLNTPFQHNNEYYFYEIVIDETNRTEYFYYDFILYKISPDLQDKSRNNLIQKINTGSVKNCNINAVIYKMKVTRIYYCSVEIV